MAVLTGTHNVLSKIRKKNHIFFEPNFQFLQLKKQISVFIMQTEVNLSYTISEEKIENFIVFFFLFF